MFNTYDVHFYASWALGMLWPRLARKVQLDFAATVPKGDVLPHPVRGVPKWNDSLLHVASDSFASGRTFTPESWGSTFAEGRTNKAGIR